MSSSTMIPAPTAAGPSTTSPTTSTSTDTATSIQVVLRTRRLGRSASANSPRSPPPTPREARTAPGPPPALQSAFFVIAVFLQQVRGFSAIEIGLVLLPATIGLLLSAAAAPHSPRTRSLRRLIRFGFFVTTLGLGPASLPTRAITAARTRSAPRPRPATAGTRRRRARAGHRTGSPLSRRPAAASDRHPLVARPVHGHDGQRRGRGAADGRRARHGTDTGERPGSGTCPRGPAAPARDPGAVEPVRSAAPARAISSTSSRRELLPAQDAVVEVGKQAGLHQQGDHPRALGEPNGVDRADGVVPAAAGAPLVVVLHGARGTGADTRANLGWDGLADREGLSPHRQSAIGRRSRRGPPACAGTTTLARQRRTIAFRSCLRSKDAPLTRRASGRRGRQLVQSLAPGGQVNGDAASTVMQRQR